MSIVAEFAQVFSPTFFFMPLENLCPPQARRRWLSRTQHLAQCCPPSSRKLSGISSSFCTSWIDVRQLVRVQVLASDDLLIFLFSGLINMVHVLAKNDVCVLLAVEEATALGIEKEVLLVDNRWGPSFHPKATASTILKYFVFMLSTNQLILTAESSAATAHSQLFHSTYRPLSSHRR